MAIETKTIWMNGEFVPAEKASVPFLNNTLHYGIGFFEGIRSYTTDNGVAIFRLKDHIRRLFDSIKIGGKMDLVREMLHLYCKKHHTDSPLCEDCEKLLTDIKIRNERCPAVDRKSVV